MDHRLYFVLGDLAANILVAAVAGWLGALIVGVGWNMLLAMILAMFIGMVVWVILFLPLAVLFGALEVMLPTMLSAMVGGMVVGMWAARAALPGAGALALGGVCGLVCIVVVWVLNNSLRGVRSHG